MWLSIDPATTSGVAVWCDSTLQHTFVVKPRGAKGAWYCGATVNGGTVNTMDLRRLSESLGSATSVSARAAGLSEKPQDRVEEDAMRKNPLVVVLQGDQGPRLPAGAPHGGRVIDVGETGDSSNGAQ